MPISPFVRRLAAVVSVLGHPLLTAPVFAAYLAGRHLPVGAGAWVLGSVLLVVGPVGAWSWLQTRRGAYTNFDISEQQQRHGLYPGLLGLLSVAVVLVLGQPRAGDFRYGLPAAWLMLLVCYGLNRWVKVSLHAAMSFFLACALWQLAGPGAGTLALAAATLVAASRWLLGRHTLPELAWGIGVGLAAGAGLAGALP